MAREHAPDEFSEGLSPSGRASPAPGQVRGRRISFVLSVFAILAATVVGVVATLTGYTHFAASEATEAMAQQLLDRTTAAVAARIERHLLPAASLADMASALPTVASAPDLLIHPVAWQLMRAESEFRSVYSAYIGFADGRFYQVISLDAAGGQARTAHDAPAAARFLQRTILPRADGKRMQLWSFLGEDRRLLDSWVDAEADFDPRQRPWYVSAMAREAQVMTALYTFHSLGLPGFTLAQRFDGDVPGVFGVDVTSADLSHFLQSVLPTVKARMAIFDEAGSIVAAPGYSADLLARRGSPATLVVPAAKLGDPVMAELIAGVPEKGSPRVAGRSSDGRHLLSVAAIDAGPAARLYVGLVAPVSDFVAPLETMRNRGLAFVALFLLIGLPLVYVVARRMSRALLDVAGQIRCLPQPGREDIVVQSFVKEINMLAEALADARESLTAARRKADQ